MRRVFSFLNWGASGSGKVSYKAKEISDWHNIKDAAKFYQPLTAKGKKNKINKSQNNQENNLK